MRLNVIFLALSSLYFSSAFAADVASINQIDAKHDFIQLNQTVDFNKNQHTRYQQTYQGYPVLGSEVIIHITANGTQFATGKFYQNLNIDLKSAPQKTAHDALMTAIRLYQQKNNLNVEMQNQESKLVVYVDQQNNAHWAYQVSFEPVGYASHPKYILDASTFQVYVQSDAVKTLFPTSQTLPADSIKPSLSLKQFSFTKTRSVADTGYTLVSGGGLGGNIKIGQVSFDGNQAAKLTFARDKEANTCFYENNNSEVYNAQTGIMTSFSCAAPDTSHNNLYWNADFESVNDGYSPPNDVSFSADKLNEMFTTWYKIPYMQNSDKSAKPLSIGIHQVGDIAYVSTDSIILGDGDTTYYPLTSPDVVAYLSAVFFTKQHSNLGLTGQSSAIAYAFSSMTAQALEYYLTQQNDWKIGASITKTQDAISYLDQPSKDCNSKTPGDNCSIDNASQYTASLDARFASGVYNRAFYLLATTPGWNTKKAYDVMVQANMAYWQTNTTFKDGACGVVKATKDYKYDTAAVISVFKQVGIDASGC